MRETLVATTAMLLVLGGTATAVTATSAASTTCTLRADVPDSNNNSYQGRTGCSGTISGTGRVYEYRNNFPDDVVGSKTFQAGLAWVNGSCGNGEGVYYAKFSSSSGASITSAKAARC